MRRLLTLLFILGASTWLGLQISKDPGYALFAYKLWTVEMPLWMVLILFVLAFAILYFFLRLLSQTGAIGRRFRAWRTQRRHRRSINLTSRGLIELAEGRWGEGEGKLLRAAKNSETPLINYLAAARAAQELGAYDRRDEYLRLAHDTTPDAEIAIGIVQAELQIQRQQFEQALATLTHIREIVPHHTVVLKLLKDLYFQLRDWKNLAQLLPSLRKYKAIPALEADELEHRTWLALLPDAWEQVPRPLQRSPRLLNRYIPSLIERGAHAEAEHLLHDNVKKNWDTDLVRWYGLTIGADAAKQLNMAEQWLKQHPQDPVLLLTLGRLCVRNQLWGKARSYLESSLALDPQPETYRELGMLLDQLGDAATATEYYKQGLVAATTKK
ncbi:MAG: heme biosynthesis protein HemY [Gammaproteobacteria bacterium]